jgi:LAO/AO transport system kinase
MTDAPRRRTLTAEGYVQGVLRGDRATLARAITLVESDAAAHQALAQEVLRQLLPHSGRSVRVGITGVPGVGKSTLIERLGVQLLAAGKRIAVLAIDPSSSLTRGSILGDKTRMAQLSQAEHAFIRPSPTGGALGGVTRKTREAILVCEAAGYDTILVETVGVGQSEISVRSMTDCFVLLALAGAGDELQAIKKGVVELADLVVLTKADGENRAHALAARADYLRALRYLSPPNPHWAPQVLACSAQTGEGVAELWEMIERFRAAGVAAGWLDERRQRQTVEWMEALLAEQVLRRFRQSPAVQSRFEELRQQVVSGQLPVVSAVEDLLRAYAQ